MVTGILGGTFNPPHVGHLALARAALDSGLADRVCMVPASVPPHKAQPREADAVTRLSMAELLSEEDERLSVDGVELERRGSSFTIDTIRILYSRHPEEKYRLILGSDMAKILPKWRGYDELLRLAPPLVAERADNKFSEDGKYSDFPWVSEDELAVMRSGRFAMHPVHISGTQIRKLLADGASDEPMRHYLTERVLGFIRQHSLYLSPCHKSGDVYQPDRCRSDSYPQGAQSGVRLASPIFNKRWAIKNRGGMC